MTPARREALGRDGKAALAATMMRSNCFSAQEFGGLAILPNQLQQCDQRHETGTGAIPKASAGGNQGRLCSSRSRADRRQQSEKRRPKRPHRANNEPTVDSSQGLCAICGTDLMKVCGLNLECVDAIGEIGVDMSAVAQRAGVLLVDGPVSWSQDQRGKVLSSAHA